MKLVKSVRTPNTELVALSGLKDEDRFRLLLIQTDNGDLVLPVDAGMYFGVTLRNLADHTVGYPAFLARDGKLLTNTYAETATILDPNQVPANGGMSEAGEVGSEYQYVGIDSIKLPNNQQQRFVVTDGDGFGGMNANEVQIFRRTRPGVTIADVFGYTARGSRGASSGPTIGTAETTEDGRKLTGLEYEQDADDPIFRIKIVFREEAIRMLVQAGLSAPDDWTCGRW